MVKFVESRNPGKTESCLFRFQGDSSIDQGILKKKIERRYVSSLVFNTHDGHSNKCGGHSRASQQRSLPMSQEGRRDVSGRPALMLEDELLHGGTAQGGQLFRVGGGVPGDWVSDNKRDTHRHRDREDKEQVAGDVPEELGTQVVRVGQGCYQADGCLDREVAQRHDQSQRCGRVDDDYPV